MLTATYSFVAINTEQKIARSALERLRQSLRNTWRDRDHVDSSLLEASLASLSEFDAYSAARKLVQYVIPAMRDTSSETDQLLAELAALSAAGKRTLIALYDTLRISLLHGEPDVYDVLTAMESYCDTSATRLGREDSHLIPLAQRCLSPDAWFAIGTRCLADDATHMAQHDAPILARPRTTSLA